MHNKVFLQRFSQHLRRCTAHSLRAAVLFAFFLTFFSCSARLVIDIAENGDITCTMNIRITRMFTDYIDDLLKFAGIREQSDSFFDLDQIKKSFASYENVTLVSISAPTRHDLNMKFTLRNDARGIAEATDGILSIFESSGNRRIRFLLNTEKYRILSRRFMIDENPILSRLAPDPDNPYTEEEYLDLIDFIFSEYSPDALSIFKNSFVDIEINTGGRVVSARGGNISGNRATFSIPVVRFLTLYEPISLEVEYR